MILASLKPYYYYLIGERKKTIEVRKSALKDLPQDIVFYMSKDEKSFAKIPKEFQKKYRKHFGKVGMKIVCDKVIRTCGWRLRGDTQQCAKRTRLEEIFPHFACLTIDEIVKYAGGENREVCGWVITDLKIYDKPKELSKFRKPLDSVYCSYFKDYCEEGCVGFGSTDYVCNDYWKWEKGLTRPPQSYMRVEELGE